MPEPARPRQKTLKALFALSYNQCAFPDCDRQIYDREHEVVLGEVAHISAQSPGGPRFDDALTKEEVHSAANLILLCADHHTIVDENIEAYPPDVLRRMKAKHEDGVPEAGSELVGAAVAALVGSNESVATAIHDLAEVAQRGYKREMALAAPVFQVRESSGRRLEEDFHVSHTLVQVTGTPTSTLRYRYISAFLLPEDTGGSWVTVQVRDRTAELRVAFDLTRQPSDVVDWMESEYVLGLEFETEAAAATYRARYRWTLSIREVPGKRLVDLGQVEELGVEVIDR